MHFRVQFRPFQKHSFINLIKLNKGYDFNLTTGFYTCTCITLQQHFGYSESTDSVSFKIEIFVEISKCL